MQETSYLDYIEEHFKKLLSTVALTKELRRVPRPVNQRRARKQQKNLFSNSGRRRNQ